MADNNGEDKKEPPAVIAEQQLTQNIAPGIRPPSDNGTPTPETKATVDDVGENPYNNYKKGDTFKGEIIDDVYFVDEKYIIFKCVGTPPGIIYDYKGEECQNNLKKIQSNLSKLLASLSLAGEKEKYLYNIASVYAICFNGDTDGANLLIRQIYMQSTLYDRTLTIGKINYLAYCLGISIAAVIAATVMQYVLNQEFKGALLYFKIGTLGSIGGFISIAIKVGNSNMNFDKSIPLQILSAVSREFIGIFSALAIYIFIKSNLVVGAVATSGNPYLFYAFAILAGFSESFIPDFFKVIETKNLGQQNNQADPANTKK